MKRRRLLAATALLLTSAAPVAVWAQDTQPAWKPTATVEFVGSGTTGSGSDALGRLIISIIEQNNLANGSFQMINKPGGGTTTAVNYMVENTGDPHTVALFSNVWMTDNMTMQESTYGLLDLTPIAVLMEDPGIIVVHADSSYETFEDFIEAARANPGTLNQSAGSPMSRDNIVRSLLMAETGADWNYVSFPSGSERLAALLGGHADIHITEVAAATEYVRSGRVRAVAAIAPERLPSFPDLPTVQELYNVEHVPLIRGIAGPPDMPAEAVTYFEDLFRQITETEEWQEYSDQNQHTNIFIGATDAREFLQDVQDQIRTAATAAGITIVR